MSYRWLKLCLLLGMLPLAWTGAQAQSAAVIRSDQVDVLLGLTDQILAGELALPQRPLAEARGLAHRRAELLIEMLREHPELGQRVAVPASMRFRMREPVADLVEELWYGFAALTVYADMPGHATRLELPDGRVFDAYTSGARAALQTKIDLPVAAVLLEGVAAVAATPALSLPEHEINALLASGLLSEVRSGRDAATGAALGAEQVTAVIGDRVVRFQRHEQLRQLAAELAAEEARRGPYVRTEALLNELDAEPDDASIEFPEEMSPWTETPKSVFLIIADFADLQDERIDQADLQARLNGGMSDAIREYSHGATWLSGDVSPKVTIGTVDSYTTLSQIRADAVAAFEALNTGIDRSVYDLHAVAFPRIGFSWAGIALLGGNRFEINGAVGDDVYVHEIGHNYGLLHASIWQTADGSVLGPLDNSDPILVEYGNEFDVMGRGYLPEAHFTVHGKNRMDWVAPALITEVNEGNGQYRVYAADHATSDESPAMALRTPKCSDGHYWVEVRTRLPGFASELEISTLERGVLVSWQPPDLGRTYQLNFGQGSSRGGALEVGRTWSDPDSCVHITPVEKGGSGVDTWADVRVNLDVDGNLAPSAYVRMPPTIHTRVRTRLEVLASDPDGDEVAYYWRLDDEPSRNVPVVERYWQGPLTDQVSVTVSDMKGGIAELAPTLNVVEPLASGWSNRDRWGEAHSWEAIHNDGEQVVVVGGSSWVARSDDGINWERGSVPGEFVHFAEVDKLGQVWVAQGLRWRWDLSEFREAVFYSLDGLTWTAALELGHVLWDLRDMACSETSCVAVGLSGLIVRTTDGVNWQQTVWPDRHSLYSVVWNGSEFHAFSYLDQVGPVVRAVFTSSDGVNWSEPQVVGCLLTPMVYLNGEYFGNCGNDLHRSIDGLNTQLVQADFRMESIAAANGVYIASGWDFFYGWRRLISDDGRSWQPLMGAADREPDIAWLGDRFIAAGRTTLDRSPRVLLDTDRDGIPDGTEQSLGLDPHDHQDAWQDLDGDGLQNQFEQYFGTHIGLPDTDGDGLGDAEEIGSYGTSPTRRDTDRDTFSDGEEIAAGSDPLDVNSCPGAECYEPESSSLLRLLPLILQQQEDSEG